MLRRALGATAILCFGLVTAAACKRDNGNEIIGDDKPSPKSKSKATPTAEPSLVKALRAPKSHRPTHKSCSRADTPAPKTATFAPTVATPPGPACSSKATCTAQPNGRCSAGHCTYDDCYDDKDCNDRVCECSEQGSRGYFCRAGNCAVDGDCGANGYCSPSVDMECGNFFGVVGFYCHTTQDECANDDDCPGKDAYGYCAYDQKLQHWRCGYGACVG